MKLSLRVPGVLLVAAVVTSGAVAGGLAYAASPAGIPPNNASLQAGKQSRLAHCKTVPSQITLCTVVRFKEATLRKNATATSVAVQCATGESATAGGWEFYAAAPIRVIQNRPMFLGDQSDQPYGWEVEARSYAGFSVRFRVYAICQSIGAAS